MLAEHDGHVPHEGYVAHDGADDVPALEVVLAAGVELGVVGGVVVTLGEQLGVGAGAELADDAVHDGYVLVPHVVDDDLADGGLGGEVPVPEEEEVAPLEGGFHGAREDDDDGGGGVGDHGEAFPHLLRGGGG